MVHKSLLCNGMRSKRSSIFYVDLLCVFLLLASLSIPLLSLFLSHPLSCRRERRRFEERVRAENCFHEIAKQIASGQFLLKESEGQMHFLFRGQALPLYFYTETEEAERGNREGFVLTGVKKRASKKRVRGKKSNSLTHPPYKMIVCSIYLKSGSRSATAYHYSFLGIFSEHYPQINNFS